MCPHRTTLHYWTRDGLTLPDAVAAVAAHWAADEPAGSAPAAPIALLYTPQACRFAVYRAPALVDESEQGCRLDAVFEARVFAPRGELRWRDDPGRPGVGWAVFLSEQDQPGPAAWSPEALGAVEVEPNHYLLWGEQWTPPEGLRPGWSCLAAGRIGTLPVPFAATLQRGQRLQLTTREYWGPAPGDAGTVHGNLTVVEERLVGLEVYSG